MGLRRFYAYARRRWHSCLFMIGLFGFISFCSLLYLGSVLVLERKNDLLFLNQVSSRIEDDIMNLKGVEAIVFQGKEGSDIPRTSTQYSSTKYKTVNTKSKKDLTIFNGTKTLSIYYGDEVRKPKYFYILGHYEQLGKTTINFMQAAMLSDILGRKIVLPYVRNSRFCGMPSGWTGPQRKKSREFLPIENYFDMISLVNVFKENNFANLATFDEFHNDCRKSKENVVIYFLFDKAAEEIKRYMKLDNKAYLKIVEKVQNNGYTDCSYISKHIKISKRINNIQVHKGICIDPEIFRSEVAFYKLLEAYTCSIVHIWRGFGFERTHFNLSLPYSFDHHLSQIKFSVPVRKDVSNYIGKNFFNQPYIGIHIRSERQLIWYSLDKFKKCVDLVAKVMKILIDKKNLKYVFLASDLTRHGSDYLHKALNESIVNEAYSYLQQKIGSVNTHTYFARKQRGLLFNDSGFVALVELGILSQANHLITLGAGTFQSWLVAVFKKHKKETNFSWSLSRACSTEVKRHK